MIPQRWEHGSFLPFALPAGGDSQGWWPAGAVLLGSGRQALRHIVTDGVHDEGWSTLHVPSYVCPSVVAAIRPLISISGYRHIPFEAPEFPALSKHAMVLVSAHFGVEPPGLSQVPAERVILDLTQDPSAPWAGAKDYAFAFASLRKTLPVPDGGLAWSGTGRSPTGLSSVGREQVVLTQDMVLAMSLKNEYLNGADIDKSQYLGLAHRYEKEVAHLPDSAGTNLTSQLMQALPVDRWRVTRGRNAQFLASLLASSSALTAYPTPFGVELQLGTLEQRDAVRSRLITSSIYPAVLWDLDRDLATPQDLAWSDRMLHLHTDYRYGDHDLERVAREVLLAAEEER